MADLGNLKQYLDDYDIIFQWGRKTYRIKPSAEEVLDFKRRWSEISESRAGVEPYMIWQNVAPFFGSTFDHENWRFGADSNPAGENHGLLPALIEEGMDLEIMDRLLSATHAKYTFGDEIAEQVMITGSLGKALQNVQQKKEKQDGAPVTQTGSGETIVEG